MIDELRQAEERQHEAARVYLQAMQDAARAKASYDLAEASVILQIESVTDSAGKKQYSNETSRKAAVTITMTTHAETQVLADATQAVHEARLNYELAASLCKSLRAIAYVPGQDR